MHILFGVTIIFAGIERIKPKTTRQVCNARKVFKKNQMCSALVLESFILINEEIQNHILVSPYIYFVQFTVWQSQTIVLLDGRMSTFESFDHRALTLSIWYFHFVLILHPQISTIKSFRLTYLIG